MYLYGYYLVFVTKKEIITKNFFNSNIAQAHMHINNM